MKKILYVILGIVVSLALYFFIVYAFISPIQKSAGRSPESYLGIVMMVIMPLCLMVGSMISGHLIQPLMKKRTIIGYLVISPGLYFAYAVILFPFCTIIWIIISIIGTYLGVFIKDKKSNKSPPSTGSTNAKQGLSPAKQESGM